MKNIETMKHLPLINEDLHTIGIMGGMSSVATGEYYQLINQRVRDRVGGFDIAELLICSVNFGNIERLVRAGEWDKAGEYLAGKARRLEAGGAEAIFLATNTMHKVREAIKVAVSIPFVDIFETVAREIKKQGKSKIGLLGTYPVMTDQFYVDVFKGFGIEVISPIEKEKQEVDRIIWDEMTKGKFLPESKAQFIAIVNRLADQGAEGVILGCTEIKILISQLDVPETPLFDTTTLHCHLAADLCTGEIAMSSLD